VSSEIEVTEDCSNTPDSSSSKLAVIRYDQHITATLTAVFWSVLPPMSSRLGSLVMVSCLAGHVPLADRGSVPAHQSRLWYDSIRHTSQPLWWVSYTVAMETHQQVF